MRQFLVILCFGTVLASVRFPEYSVSQLNNAEFVKAEITKYQAIRDKLQADIGTSPAIIQVTMGEDLKKTDCLLEALRYVEVHGLKLDDPGLGKLSFFQKVPVGSTILLPKPQVHMAARISTSKAATPSRATQNEPTGTAAEESTELKPMPGEVPAGISHGEQIDLTDYLAKGQTTVFDFYSQYCPPCREIAPILERLDQKRSDLTVVKVDINRAGVAGIDWQSPVARQFDLHSVPHFKIYAPDGTLQAEGQAGYGLVALLIEESGLGIGK